MASLLKSFFEFVMWILVPLILLIVFYRSYAVSKHLEESRSRSSARAGFWAGILLFVMFLIYQVSLFIESGFPVRDIYQGFDIILALGGAAAGFLIATGGKKMFAPGLQGIAILLVTFLTASSFIHYVFIRTYNTVLLSLILGITFGVLAQFAAAPFGKGSLRTRH